MRLTHGNQIHAAFGFAQVFGYDERDIVINGFPFFHVGGTMTVGLSVLAAGGHIVVPSPYGLRPPAVDRALLARWSSSFGVTVVGGVPTSIAALTNSWKPGTDVSSVRMAVTGGAVLPKAVGSRFEATTGIRLFETYGMTETAAAIAFNPGRGDPVAGSVGFRAPYLRNPHRPPRCRQHPGPVRPNETGLVQVRGPQVFPGYVDPAHNEGTLDADGWLTTGDVGYLTEDAAAGADRPREGPDHPQRPQHRPRGDRGRGQPVSPACRSAPRSACRTSMPARCRRCSSCRRRARSVDVEALKRYLDANVHEPPARPKSVLVIDALPVTAVGKIFKPTLRDLAIKEKVRLEVERLLRADVHRLSVEVRLDEHKRTVVEVAVSGANASQLAELEAALKPLPQTYLIRAAEV